MMRLRLCVRPLLAMALAAGCAAMGSAQQFYARAVQTVRAGTLLIESQTTAGVPSNFAPHVWHNLDSFRSVKPTGWTFANPRGNTYVTAAVAARWTALGGSPPAVGTAGLGKSAASYWEVRLSEASDDVLAEYDILLLPAYGSISLNPFEREKLRRYLDAGGTLWLDFAASSSLDPLNGFPVPFDLLNAGTANRFADALHPLLSYPNPINPATLDLIEPSGLTGARRLDFQAIGAGALIGLAQPLEAESANLQPVAGTGTGSTISVAKVGEGFLLVTTRGAATALNRVASGGGFQANLGFFGLAPVLDRSSEVAAKLIINAISLRASFTQAGGGNRKTGGTPIGIDAPLMQSFRAPLELADGTVPPVLFKGLLVVAAGDRVYVYDANPKADLDNDGDPDDGLRDYSQGSNMDLLWQSQALSGPISAPLAIEASNAANGVPIDQVLVVDGNGRLQGFDAFQIVDGRIDHNPGDKAPDYSVSPPSGGGGGSGVPPSPTYQDGIVFVADSVASGLSRSGRVWLVDPRLGAAVVSNGTPFSVGGGGSNSIPQPGSGPTVGYIPISNNSGGLDRVVYLPTLPNTAGTGPSSFAGITSLWLGVKGEAPVEWVSTPGSLQITTRAAVQALNIYVPNEGSESDLLGVRISVVNKNTGAPLNRAQMEAIFSGSVPGESGGILTYTLQDNVTLDQNLYDIRLDYTINWGTGIASQAQQILRGSVQLSDNGNRARRILGDLALSPKGTLFAVMADPTETGAFQAGGTFYALKEEGRGTFRLLSRYDLNKPFTWTPNGGAAVQTAETLIDSDPVQNFAAPFIGGRFSNLRFVSGPVLRHDVAYVLARGGKGAFGVPTTIVMAFDGDPQSPEIRLNDLGDGAFALIQPDVTRSTNDTQPEIISQMSSTQFKYERQDGASTATIRLESLMPNNRGPITNSLSLSMPVYVRRQGQPDQRIEPDRTAGSRWNPLLWYAAYHGFRSSGNPFLAGRNLYFSGASGLPSILSGGSPLVTTAQVYAISADIAPNDGFLLGNPDRPWQKQAISLKLQGSDIRTNPSYLWPQGTGVTTFEQYRTRLLQTVLTGSTQAFGVVGGEGMVVAWGNGGLYGFNRADFLIVDSGRVGRYDGSGNPIWTSDLAAALGLDDSGSVGSVAKLVRPVRSYRIGENDLLVVDAGANRVVRLDSAGRELRSISRFKVDPNFVPDGFQANAPLTLSEPRDATVYSGYRVNPARVSNPQPLEFWRHYVIADSGNKRIVEVIDRFAADPTTRQITGTIEQGLLFWQTPASLTGKDFDYSSLARAFTGSGYVYIAGLGRSAPARADIGLDTPGPGVPRETRTGNGGLLIIDPADNSHRIVRTMLVPGIAANILWNEATQTFENAARPAWEQEIGSVTSVSARWVSTADEDSSELAVMITDPSGVYELVGSLDGAMTVRWMLTRETFTKMRGLTLPFGGTGQPTSPGAPAASNARGFLPLYARRLDSGEVLVVNAYQGQTRGNRQTDGTFTGRNLYQGEVIQLDGSIDLGGTNDGLGFSFNKVNLGFGIRSIRFELPPITGARTLLLPVFADRR